jgi:enoyl-CoA hydratase/carnithine racemase
MTGHIKIEHRDHVVTLTFARPDKNNALTNAMYGTLADAIIAAETDPLVRVIVLRGEGDMYTACNDVGEFALMAASQFRGFAWKACTDKSPQRSEGEGCTAADMPLCSLVVPTPTSASLFSRHCCECLSQRTARKYQF